MRNLTGKLAVMLLMAGALAMPASAAIAAPARVGGAPHIGGGGAPHFGGGGRAAFHAAPAGRSFAPHVSGRSFTPRVGGPSFTRPIGNRTANFANVHRGTRANPSVPRAQRLQRLTHGNITQHQFRGTRQNRVTPRVAKHAGLRQHTSRIYTQRRMQRLSGKHHRRYRHRRGGYLYNHGGWWYAFPWWLSGDSGYDYWSNVCASRSGYGTPEYYSCMAYYGFY